MAQERTAGSASGESAAKATNQADPHNERAGQVDPASQAATGFFCFEGTGQPIPIYSSRWLIASQSQIGTQYGHDENNQRDTAHLD